jgi:AcrR family transcriptional regulator
VPTRSAPLSPAATAGAARTRGRDAEASRRAILDAAEHLFADRGYDGASLAEIGRRAGVSAALPAYFFGGKRGLYEAVLERLVDEGERRVGRLSERVAHEFEHGGELHSVLESLIDGYLDLLGARPALVRLLAREALAGARPPGRRPTPVPAPVALAGGLTRLLRSLSPPAGPAVDPQQLLITVLALCVFPLEHGDTLLAGMGLNATGASFAAARKAHVVDVLERVLGGAAAQAR